METPVGQRHDSQREFLSRLEQNRMNYDDWKHPDKYRGRKNQTSVYNPLVPLPGEEPPMRALKTYPRNTHMGTMAHLAPGSLEPLSRAEVRAARAEAKRSSRESSPARRQDGDSPPGHAGREAKRQGMKGHGQDVEGCAIAEGEEEGGSNSGYSQCEEEEEEELRKLDSSEKEALRNAALKQVVDEVAMVKQVEADLIREYPHGVPRIVIMRVQKELGLRLPSLGFGEAQSLSDMMARASLRD
ncbi:hypothetical protein DUNSADRAFT_1737 [Dunaliella salina]|uniref:Uncharacterized protein n=1 Tax=Dunaliella salina TaxID=3046 RepID=A0ABQ7GWP9_DUNSA|nr:hypothetical protein DUNSADRAFT_1737 [Dunaliella salina]|eukprot:KAF5839039.1 hypothetical protein DUNSADRAFT_1737 [Dunaliella salina]